MPTSKKITVQVPEADLVAAQTVTGKGVSATVRLALKRLAQLQAQRELAALRGKIKFALDADELR